MTETILLWILGTVPALAVSGGLAAVGIAGSAFGLFQTPIVASIARYAGIFMLALFCFSLGVRTADDRQAQKNALQTERNKVAALQRDLDAQKQIAASVSQRRDELLQQKASLDERLSKYENEIQERQSNAPNNACILSDRDFRNIDGLRHKPRRR